MKWTILTILLFSCFTAIGQKADTIAVKDISTHLGKEVVVKCRVIDFDSRTNLLYLYIGNRFPNHLLTIIVKKQVNGKRLKIDKDIILGRQMVYFTGKLINYTENPDTTALTDQAMLKREVEQPQAGILEYTGQAVTIRHTYEPRTGPIDLRGKLVMIIDDRKQVGTKKYPIIMNVN
ncbi:hypothetical protein ACRQ5D_07605 [Mucilaginibacter sp. P25]|uniref:Uncharacterized protein n=1 Tax=Mucilaginibacter gossypii TaxID=551996 RepID=A0A1G8B3M3_9SPHI|nr:hypothetical protein [Mucilaginibacter gossypii]SDH27852.1 hypothetical protein SAMN05192573_10867 [Mucilaginibacter gossypii]